MKRFLALALAALAAPCYAADVKILGAAQPVPAPRFAVLTVDGLQPDDRVTWKFTPAVPQRADVSPGVVHVAGVTGSSYKVEVRIINFKAERFDEGEAILSFGDAPLPPPGPQPGPTPSPAPIPVPGLRVLIVRESADDSKMPAAQQSILYGAKAREYLDAKCVVGPDGKTPERRIWDKDVDTSRVPKLWQDAMARPRKSLPWLIVSNGKSGYEGPLPATVDEFLDRVKTYAE